MKRLLLKTVGLLMAGIVMVTSVPVTAYAVEEAMTEEVAEEVSDETNEVIGEDQDESDAPDEVLDETNEDSEEESDEELEDDEELLTDEIEDLLEEDEDELESVDVGISGADEVELGSEMLVGPGYRYEVSPKKKLTLTDYSGKCFSSSVAGELEVVLNGNNDIWSVYEDTAIRTNGTLTISGTGEIDAHGSKISSKSNIFVNGGRIYDADLCSENGTITINDGILKVNSIEPGKVGASWKPVVVNGGQIVTNKVPYLKVQDTADVLISSINSMAVENLVVEKGTVSIEEKTTAGVYTTTNEYPLIGTLTMSGGTVDVSGNYCIKKANVNGGELTVTSAARAMCTAPTVNSKLYIKTGENENKAVTAKRVGAEKYVKIWQAFTVSFQTNGGLNTVEPQAVVYGDTVVKPYGVAPPVGYELDYWYNGDPTKEYDFATPVKASMTLSAKWKPRKYKVTFVDEDDIDTPIASDMVLFNEPYGTLPVPTKAEYDFVGWYTRALRGTLITAETKLFMAEDHTLIARWKKHEYAVTLNLDGGMIGGADTLVVNVPSGERVDKQYDYSEPLKPGAKFSKWVIESSEADFDVTTSILKDYSLKAVYTERYKVEDPSFNIDAGTVKKGTRVELKSSTIGANIYYTLDGTTPTSSSTLYDDAIVINNNCTVKAVAIRTGFTNSEVITKAYTVDTAPDWGGSEDGITAEDQAALGDDTSNIPAGLWTAGDKAMDYTGEAITFPDLRVYSYNKKLTLNKDYSISYANNKNAGTASFTITGKGDYSGKITKRFLIKAIPINSGNISADDIYLAYNARAVQKGTSPVVYTAADGSKKTLKLNTEYTLEYLDSSVGAYKEPGTYAVTIRGKGNYSGTVTFDEIITQKVLMKNVKVSAIPKQTGTGAPLTPSVTVTYGKNITLVEGVDYDIDYKNNTQPGKGIVVLTGKGPDYAGVKEVTFDITGLPLSKAIFDTANLTKAFPFDGNSHEPVVKTATSDASVKYVINTVTTPLKGVEKSVFDNPATDKTPYDYCYEYVGDTSKVGTVKIVFTGVNRFAGSVTKSFQITGTPITEAVIRYQGIYTYQEGYKNGECKPDEGSIFEIYVRKYNSSTRKYENHALSKDADYTVTYVTNKDGSPRNIDVGSFVMEITGINGYTGTVKKTIKIEPFDMTTNKDLRIDVELSGGDDVPYQKNGAKPNIVVRDSKKSEPLVLNKDYTLSFSNNTELYAGGRGAEKPTVTVEGKGNYKGTIEKTYKITQKSLTQVDMTASDIVYQNKANICKSVLRLKDTDGGMLTLNTDYEDVKYFYARDVRVNQIVNKKTVSYVRRQGSAVDTKDIIPAGAEIRVVVKGMGKYKDTNEAYFRFVNNDISKATIKIDPQIYKGAPVVPTKDDVTISYGGSSLSKSEFEIIEVINNKGKGTGKVTIRGLGNFGGTKTVSFTIKAMSMNYIVSFDSNAAGVTGTMKTVEMSTGVALAKNSFKRKGYNFAGWLDSKGNVLSDRQVLEYTQDDYAYGSKIVLKAIWTPIEYTITYMPQGGTIDSAVMPMTYNIEDGFTIPDPETRTGYTFGGWYLEKACRNRIVSIEPGRTGNLKLYAKWIAQ